jgi:hypothetical protein
VCLDGSVQLFLMILKGGDDVEKSTGLGTRAARIITASDPAKSSTYAEKKSYKATRSRINTKNTP